MTPVYEEYLKVKEEINFAILEIVRKNGSNLHIFYSLFSTLYFLLSIFYSLLSKKINCVYTQFDSSRRTHKHIVSWVGKQALE